MRNLPRRVSAVMPPEGYESVERGPQGDLIQMLMGRAGGKEFSVRCRESGQLHRRTTMDEATEEELEQLIRLRQRAIEEFDNRIGEGRDGPAIEEGLVETAT
jgi:hypothetical protein